MNGEIGRLAGPTIEALLFDLILPVVSLVIGVSADEKAKADILKAVTETIAPELLDLFKAVVNRHPVDILSLLASLLKDIILAAIDYFARTLGKSVLKSALKYATVVLEVVDDVHSLIDLARFDFDTTNTPLTTSFDVRYTGNVPVVIRSVAGARMPATISTP
jgi:hypothetical protein